MGAKATNAIPPNKRRIPPIMASIAITVTPTGRFVSNLYLEICTAYIHFEYI